MRVILRRQIGEDAVTARARRHLYKMVVDLRIAENDHLENEEAFVLPVVRERMSEEGELARRLMIDEDSENPGWVLEWMVGYLTPGEKKLLDKLEARFTGVTSNAT